MGGDGSKSLGKAVDGPISRLINRRVSGAITGLILRSGLNITPNQVSWASFALAAAASYFIASGELLVGGILVQLSSIIDGVDGELARARGLSSPRGGFLDTMLDRYSDILIYLGLLWFLASDSVILIEVLVLSLALSGDLMVSYLHAKGHETAGKHPALVGPLDSAASRDVRLFILFLSCVAGQPLTGLIAVAVLSHVYVLVKSATIYSIAPNKSF